ncbi:hypothetical protein D3C77_299990 [compost metagenome]|uniref:hypothetical protein n=1 Tax=Pseudomonas sp. 5 TaxID=1619949 RepID=UPI0005EB6286|nr:hypothetical protein [Pseudomonas sp. 5]KJK09310.1 hypothetical protein UB47_01855 [Pseudomonas sp. 5]
MKNPFANFVVTEPQAEFIVTDDYVKKLVLRLNPEDHEALSDLMESDGDNWVAKPGREQEFNITLENYMVLAHREWLKNGGRRREVTPHG